MTPTSRRTVTPSRSESIAAHAERGSLEVTSPDFASGGPIPRRHAFPPEGDNVRPEIRWSEPPPGAAEIAIVVDDPDAPRKQPWVHWVAWRLPKDAAGVTASTRGLVEGRNDFGRDGWGGPLPPEGDAAHHYRFRVLALDAPVTIRPGSTKDDLLKATRGHVLAEGEVVGTYRR